MPTIRDISLFLGRSSHSKEESVTLSFNVDFSSEEQSWEQGFIMHILLIDVNEGTDQFYPGSFGITRGKETGSPDRIVGEIYNGVVNPAGSTMRIEKTRSWEFGTLDEGEEEFRALIAVIPVKSGTLSPVMAMSDPVRIDLG